LGDASTNGFHATSLGIKTTSQLDDRIKLLWANTVDLPREIQIALSGEPLALWFKGEDLFEPAFWHHRDGYFLRTDATASYSLFVVAKK
jgi:hypothetical protein